MYMYIYIFNSTNIALAIEQYMRAHPRGGRSVYKNSHMQNAQNERNAFHCCAISVCRRIVNLPHKTIYIYLYLFT